MKTKYIIHATFLTSLVSILNIFDFGNLTKAETLQHKNYFEIEEVITNNNQHIFNQDFGKNINVEDNNLKKLAQQYEEAPNSNEDNEEDWPSPIEDDEIFWLLLVNELEYRASDGKDLFKWDVEGWVGGDYERVWIKTEGDVAFAEKESGEAEVQVLYGLLIDPFWDLQVGLRYEREYTPDDDKGRAFAVIGVEGLAPGLYEVDTALFISEDGDVSVRFEVERELLITQQLILQPSFEINLAAQEVESFGIGSGINDIELGLRLRYEINRNYAPYIGINWIRLVGETEQFAREEGESIDTFSFVAGLRMLF